VLGLRVEVYQEELADGCRLAEGGDSAGLRSVTVPVLSLFSVRTVPLNPRWHVLTPCLVVDGLDGVGPVGGGLPVRFPPASAKLSGCDRPSSANFLVAPGAAPPGAR
jgi:hypothetical protein